MMKSSASTAADSITNSPASKVAPKAEKMEAELDCVVQHAEGANDVDIAAAQHG